MKKVLMLVVIMLAALAAVAPTASATNGPPEKVTICHVAGRADDPANYITLTIPWVAVYGQAGHFNEDGTPQAGHEQDSLGPCNPPPPPECPDGDLNGDLPGCDAPPPPECPNGDLNGEAPGCDAPPPPPPPCVPQNEDGSLGGKDGIPGNDDCAKDPEPEVPGTPETPEPPVVEPPVVEPPVVEPPVKEEPEVEKPEKPKPEKPQAEKPEASKPPKRTSTDKETLPYTGVPLLPVVGLGAGLMGLGRWMRRRYPK